MGWHPDFGTYAVARFLGEFGLDACSRDTLRALLPKGKMYGSYEKKYSGNGVRGSKRRNRTSVRFQSSLKYMEECGWISREEYFVRILDPDALRSFADGHMTQGWTVLLRQAATQIAEEIEANRLAPLIEARLNELESVRRLALASTAVDKQIRLRTGLDDHLELGIYVPPKVRSVPPGPVQVGHLSRSEPGEVQ